MVSSEEHIDVSLLTYDDIAEIDLEIHEPAEFTLFQKFLTLVETLMVGYLLAWCFYAFITNAGLVSEALSKAFIFD